MLTEEVSDFAVLVVTLRRHKHSLFRLLRQVLADLRDRKHDLLQSAVTADHLNLTSMLWVIVQRHVSLAVSVDVRLCGTQLIR